MQNLRLSIPEPCNENWQQMTPTEQGRFCKACVKEVVDFSTMTDMQVLNYFSNLTHEKVCGRALPEQLDRTITRPEPPKKKLFWYWNYVVMFFMFFTKANTVKAQGGIKASCSKPISASDSVKIKQAGINNALAGKVGEVAVILGKNITGKVTDINGNPVSFASIKIKGTNTGVTADANGAYSLIVKPDAVLIISGAGFKDAEVVAGIQSFINTVMEKGGIDFKEVIITGCRAVRLYYNATFVIKDMGTGIPIIKAKIVLVESGYHNADMAFTDNAGKYQAIRMNVRKRYDVKITAEGYQANEFSIEPTGYKNRKSEWEVLLKKELQVKGASVRSNSMASIGTETRVRLGQVQVYDAGKSPVYVVDGIVRSNAGNENIDPDDIDNLTVLQGPEAAALFGPDGKHGAIVITTRKAKEIKLKEVVVTTMTDSRMKGMMVGSVTYVNSKSLLDEKITTLKTILTDSIKIYPNPVQRNSEFAVQLKLKQPGSNYSFLITDAAGRVLLQRRFNASSKNHTEKIAGDSRWAAGLYHIRVFDTRNKLISISSFVFQ